MSFEMNHMNSEPIKFPSMHIIIDKSNVLATPSVIMFAIQCWKPQNINNGIPYIMPRGVPFLYINTAIYIIIPHKSDFTKNEIDNSHVATLLTALLNTSISTIEYNSPNK